MEFLGSKSPYLWLFLLAILAPMPALTSVTWSEAENEPSAGESPYTSSVHSLKEAKLGA